MGCCLGLYLGPRLIPFITSSPGWIFVTAWYAALIYGVIQAFRYKNVDLDSETLIIANFGQEIRVPLAEVSDVKGGLGGKNPIKIEFRNATDFGQSIKFLPPRRRLWAWQRHPLVKELRELCHLTGVSN